MNLQEMHSQNMYRTYFDYLCHNPRCKETAAHVADFTVTSVGGHARKSLTPHPPTTTITDQNILDVMGVFGKS